MRILLADDNELLRIGLRTITRVNIPDAIISEASTLNELKESVEKNYPDVVLMDYTSEEIGIRSVLELKKIYPKIKIVAITYLQTGKTIVDALKAGVMSYIKKDCEVQEIIDAVIDTSNGNSFFCGKILETIAAEGIDVESIEFDPLSCEPVSLSEREIEIIKLIAHGMTNGQIADKLFLSSHTVNTHRRNIMAKLGVNNTAGIVMYAIKTHLVSPNKFLFST